jgi:hypothetical protein
MKLWADWLADNPRDHARCPGLTVVHVAETAFLKSAAGTKSREIGICKNAFTGVEYTATDYAQTDPDDGNYAHPSHVYHMSLEMSSWKP